MLSNRLKYQKNGHRQRIAWQTPEIRRLVTWHLRDGWSWLEIAKHLPTQRRTNNDCYDKWRNLLTEFFNNLDALKDKYLVAHDEDFDTPDDNHASLPSSPTSTTTTTVISILDEEEETKENDDDDDDDDIMIISNLEFYRMDHGELNAAFSLPIKLVSKLSVIMGTGHHLHNFQTTPCKLFNQSYVAKEAYFRSSDIDRTLMSVECILLGVYPPGTGPIVNNQPALPFGIQLVPIHTIPRSDEIYLLGENYCPTYEWQTLLKNNAEFLAYLAKVTACPLETDSSQHNLPHQALLFPCRSSMIQESINHRWDVLGNLGASPLINETLYHMNKVISGDADAKKYIHWSGHDVTLMSGSCICFCRAVKTNAIVGDSIRDWCKECGNYFTEACRSKDIRSWASSTPPQIGVLGSFRE
ncbi:Acid phosphatase, prostate [Balamuthia mandrillaris]